MTTVHIDYRDLEFAERDIRANAARIAPMLQEQVRSKSLDAMRQVKILMPVDTGKARATWGDIWDEWDGGLTIEQSTTNDYTGALNEGHSRQAPAGFIDGVAMEIGEQLADAIANELSRIIGA